MNAPIMTKLTLRMHKLPRLFAGRITRQLMIRETSTTPQHTFRLQMASLRIYSAHRCGISLSGDSQWTLHSGQSCEVSP